MHTYVVNSNQEAIFLIKLMPMTESGLISIMGEIATAKLNNVCTWFTFVGSPELN
jgi:hypothetical protein